MILQALNRYYDILIKDPQAEVAPFGYGTVNVGFALNLSTEGDLLDVLPLYTQEQRGNKVVEVPRPMIVPEQVKRTSGVNPNFLCDTSAYVLGLSGKDEARQAYSQDRFSAFRRFNSELLAKADSDAARATAAYLERHEPSTANGHPAIIRYLDALLSGGNLVFLFRGAFVHEDPAIREVWGKYKAGLEAVSMQCLVTGEIAPIARLHPSLKRVRGAQSSGATLVGFNASAYESYGHTQGLISPVSEVATFAYGTALNYLLSERNPNKKFFLGDATVVYWAESDSHQVYEGDFASLLDPDYVEDEASLQNEGRAKAEAALKETAGKVRRAQMIDLKALQAHLEKENPRFFVLGLAPNAARVSVRFFITDPFEEIIRSILAHYDDMEIVREYENQPRYLTVGRVLSETVSKKSRDKDASPLLAGAVFRAILANTPYPTGLYYAIINRIRADADDADRGIHKINYVRAAAIKAFLIRKYRYQSQNPFKEVLVMALNEQSTIPAYVLGRLFAVLEKVQLEAIGNINASIKDRYFTSACASPRSVFPILLRLSQHHIAKAEYGYASDRRIQDILNLLDIDKNPIPAHLNLDEQGIFVLGYYHQRAAFYNQSDRQALAVPTAPTV